MRVSRLKTILFLSSFLLTLFSIPIAVRADDNDDDDDYDVKARVVRISLLEGDVSLKRGDSNDWEAVKLNYPLVEGDTIATAVNSNLEIQVDARNFIRLSGNSVLRIVTLRDEGIAVSAVEGTVMLRLANFDRKRGYFEIDGPKTTLAPEKNGLYRIDVPKNGRVRLTVRGGGSARIYSDTSGFSLRDGRAAELIVEGENAGDWDLMAAAPTDAIDSWVAERERYLAQRSKYDVKYYDEYVWGGEDLDAYGDWFKTDDYGWIWRPFPNSISVYSDWAPYRYGQWEWCPPYGWTWIGYEPWGWAPYHYGRWVYYNGYWAWCPRGQFNRNRSWWRPSLVAFVFDLSFGDNVCWYPLNYYQRDPHSRKYRHDDRDRDRDRDRHDGRRRHDGYENWRGVTRMPRRDFGNPDRRGHRVEEPVARRVVDRDPERNDVARRGGWGRVPTVHIPDRPTGAAERTPGVALDEDLRRNRVFRGREPRPNQPSQPAASAPAGNTNTPVANTETQPTGAVARPEPRIRRGEPRPDPPSGNPEERRSGGRSDRPRNREGSENSGGSGQQTTEPRNEQPATVTEPPPENPRVERRERETPAVRPETGNESRPRVEPRAEPRSEPRSEPRESRPEPRSESPRSEPRRETPRSESPRSESPRTESPRSEPRHESPRSESPRSESPRSESPRSEPPRSEAPRSEPPRSEPARESPRSDPESSRPKPDKPMF